MTNCVTTATPARILVADDNPTNVLLLTRSLEKQGYAVLPAVDGVAAVNIARQERPDLLLLDVMMPHRDGLEVCRILKEDPTTSSIPIIFVTARAEPDEVVQALSIGGSDYITKPFIIKEVIARVGVHLRLRQFEKELVARNEELERLSERLADMNVELSRLTRTDPLTGLLNRRAWHEVMTLEYERCRRQDSQFGIIMIDVDHFKAYNDSVGHQAGDECLCKLAHSIQVACRALDSIGRYGGEEFIVLCPETDQTGAAILAERICRAIWDLNLPHRASPTATRLTVSIGACCGCARDPWEQIVKCADEQLYLAKQSGRNCFRLASSTVGCVN